MNQLKIKMLSFLFVSTGLNANSQEVKSPDLIKVEKNGVAVYSSSGYETTTTKNVNIERKVIGIDDWTLEECLSGLVAIKAKIEYCQEIGDVNEVNRYNSEKEKIEERISLLKQSIEE